MQDAVNAARDASLCYEAVKWIEEAEKASG